MFAAIASTISAKAVFNSELSKLFPLFGLSRCLLDSLHNRMILYISTQSNSFDEHVDIINDKDLWQVISANDLPLDFIRQWKDKLDWSYLSMVKCFTDEEKEEFSDYILTPVQKEITDESFIDSSDFKFIDKMTDEELEDLINEISKHIGK